MHPSGPAATFCGSTQRYVVPLSFRMDRDRVTRWRRIDLTTRIKALFGVVTLGCGRLLVRPHRPKTDEGTQKAFKNRSRCW